MIDVWKFFYALFALINRLSAIIIRLFSGVKEAVFLDCFLIVHKILEEQVSAKHSQMQPIRKNESSNIPNLPDSNKATHIQTLSLYII